jgi:C4-type Zn-finger protein
MDCPYCGGTLVWHDANPRVAVPAAWQCTSCGYGPHYAPPSEVLAPAYYAMRAAGTPGLFGEEGA